MFLEKSKKALSSVVITLILIGVALILAGIVWFILQGILEKESGAIEKAHSSIYSILDLRITKAQASYSSEKLTVRVRRNSGGGDLIGINFIVSNETLSGAVKKYVELGEQEEQNFIFDMSEFGFTVETAYEVSISPIAPRGTGESIGDIMDTRVIDKNASSGGEGSECSKDTDCGTNSWTPETEYCNESSVWQEWKGYTCDNGECNEETTHKLRENCSLQDKICFDGECIDESPACSESSDCGADAWILGTEYCNESDVWQLWKEFKCDDEACGENITGQFKENCSAQEKSCFEGECFVELECMEHSDCDIGEMCDENKCIPENVINTGTIYSIWPLLGVAEYFDSSELPKTDADYVGYFAGFTGTETRCFEIKEYVLPESPSYNSYIRLNSTSAIQSEDGYEIWETLWGCSN